MVVFDEPVGDFSAQHNWFWPMGSALTGKAPQQLTESPFKYLKWRTEQTELIQLIILPIWSVYQLLKVKDVPGGFPKSDLFGVTVALIHEAAQRFLAV